MLMLAGIGLLANVIMVAVGMFLTRRRNASDQALYMMCLPSMNIGAFCIPFVQSFMPALGTVSACMFDVGNSIACTGGTYAFTSQYIDSRHSHSSQDRQVTHRITLFIRKLVTSTPLMTYIVMFTITVIGWKLPDDVLTLISPMCAANPFLAMFMIGSMIRIEFKKEYLADIVTIVGLRHLLSIALAAICFFLLPWDIVIRQALVIVAFAPLSVIAPAYTGMCGGDEGKASTINSVTLIVSIVEITALLVGMGLR